MRAFDARAEFVIDGSRYRWSGWFGCQLESLEWRMLPAGTTRDLHIHMDESPVRMTVFSTKREGFRVRTTWAVSNHGTHDEHATRIHNLQDQLRRVV